MTLEQVKDARGLGRDPDDASWLSIQQLNRTTQKLELRGEVLITIEVLPRDSATVRAEHVGATAIASAGGLMSVWVPVLRCGCSWGTCCFPGCAAP